jgi:hypothetical protein
VGGGRASTTATTPPVQPQRALDVVHVVALNKLVVLEHVAVDMTATKQEHVAVRGTQGGDAYTTASRSNCLAGNAQTATKYPRRIPCFILSSTLSIHIPTPVISDDTVHQPKKLQLSALCLCLHRSHLLGYQ